MPISHCAKPSLAQSVDSCSSQETTFTDLKRVSVREEDLEAQIHTRRHCATTRFVFLDIYRRLFSLVYCTNAVAFVIVMTRSSEKLLTFVNATGINLLVCGLARQPLVVNAIFLGICCIPRSAPLFLRKLAAKAHHYGGVHSGCGVAALLWYIGLVALISRDFLFPNGSRTISIAVFVLSYIILAVLLVIIFVAYPLFRTGQHDYFELIHRFLSWSLVALFLTLLLVFSDTARHEQGMTLGQYLLRLPAFWCLMIIIVSIVHPWVLLRRIQVRPEYLSPHAIRLHLDHTSTAFGKVIALSMHPLKDWHSFATFPDPGGQSFSCLVSKAGDWTSRCIDQQPTVLWKRGVMMYGFIHVMRVFRRVVVVTTGSGIGPCLSFLSETERPPLRIVWQTRNPFRTYGEGVVNLVSQMDPNAVIIDTVSSGRVDMIPVVRGLIRDFDAEAVCVISNPGLTKRLVFDLEASGIPAFGPIFDS